MAEDVIARSEATKQSPHFSKGGIASLPEPALSITKGSLAMTSVYSFFNTLQKKPSNPNIL
jgi:hypothetical protein